MNKLSGLRSLACGVLLMAALSMPVRAQGTYNIPPGAHFNPDKLARVGDYLRDLWTTRAQLRRFSRHLDRHLSFSRRPRGRRRRIDDGGCTSHGTFAWPRHLLLLFR